MLLLAVFVSAELGCHPQFHCSNGGKPITTIVNSTERCECRCKDGFIGSSCSETPLRQLTLSTSCGAKSCPPHTYVVHRILCKESADYILTCAMDYAAGTCSSGANSDSKDSYNFRKTTVESCGAHCVSRDFCGAFAFDRVRSECFIYRGSQWRFGNGAPNTRCYVPRRCTGLLQCGGHGSASEDNDGRCKCKCHDGFIGKDCSIREQCGKLRCTLLSNRCRSYEVRKRITTCVRHSRPFLLMQCCSQFFQGNCRGPHSDIRPRSHALHWLGSARVRASSRVTGRSVNLCRRQCRRNPYPHRLSRRGRNDQRGDPDVARCTAFAVTVDDRGYTLHNILEHTLHTWRRSTEYKVLFAMIQNKYKKCPKKKD